MRSVEGKHPEFLSPPPDYLPRPSWQMERPQYEEEKRISESELPTLASLPSAHALPTDDILKEKASSNEKDSTSESIEVADEKADFHAYSGSYSDDEKPEYRNGEPIITSGRDVSRFAVDLRDDGDAALTFRSMFLGTMFAGMGAALCQVRLVYNPTGSPSWPYNASTGVHIF